jgi:hypothetical protein
VPRDPAAVAYDTVLSEERKTAIEYFQENEPEVLNLPPTQREAVIRDAARTIAADNAATAGGFGSRLTNYYAQMAPSQTMDVGVGRATVGNALDLVGVGPESATTDPVGFGASVAANAASMIPGGGLIKMLPGPSAQMLSQGVRANLPGVFTAARRAEQIIGPAMAAGGAGFLGRTIEEINSVPEIPLNSDSKAPVSPAGVFLSALDEAKKQSIFEIQGGLLGLGTSLGIKGVGIWMRGSKEHFDSAMDSLRLAGVRREAFSLQEVTDNRLISGASSIIGVMPIPILSKRFIRAKERVSKEVSRIGDEILDDVSPQFSVLKHLYDQNPERYGKLMAAESEKAFAGFGAAMERYSVVRMGLSTGVINDIRRQRLSSAAASTRTTALQQLSTIATKRDLPLTRDKTGQITNMKVLAGFSPKIATFLEQIQNMPRGTVELDRLINLKGQARDALNAVNPNNPLKNEERVALTSIKAALETDITAAIKASGSPQLQADYDRLATLDGDWLTLLSGHLDRRASKVQKTFGSERLSESSGTSFGLPDGFQRRQGTLDMGSFIDDMLDNASPKEIQEFAVLLRESGPSGQESIRFATARYLEKMLGSAKTVATEGGIEVTHHQKLRDFISKGEKGGEEERRFWQLMTEAGVDKKRLRNFVDATETLWSQFPPAQSKFIARSVILRQGKNPVNSIASMATGGLLGATTSTAGAAAFGSVSVGAVMSAFLLSQYTQIATNPKYLSAVVAVLDPSFGSGAKARAAERIFSSSLYREWENGVRVEAGQGADVMAGALNRAQQVDPLNNLAGQARQYFNQNPSFQGEPAQ